MKPDNPRLAELRQSFLDYVEKAKDVLPDDAEVVVSNDEVARRAQCANILINATMDILKVYDIAGSDYGTRAEGKRIRDALGTLTHMQGFVLGKLISVFVRTSKREQILDGAVHAVEGEARLHANLEGRKCDDPECEACNSNDGSNMVH